ncbi:MAG: Jag N-terminal domain-containing protein [Oscillospiraceae bacterium]|nr:Jag N-terminal domain-containing protein [Oscillospiraceae bacterium]
MEKTIVTSGKTIDLAIEAALTQLGLDRDSVSVQVLQQAKPGFLGLGAQPAKVEVTYEAPDPAPKVALSSASRSKPKAKKPEAPKAEAPKAEPKSVKTEASKAEPKPAKPEHKPAKPEHKPEPKVEAPKTPKTYAPAEAGSVEEKIEVFLKGLLEHMGSTAIPHAWKEEGNTYKVDLVGEDLGYLIGRRGDTLDALQHLANYSVGRNVEGHIRISVDAEDYREKREDSLRRYARKKAQQVLKARRRTTLEPMNAYERHVIHAALQDMDNITTHSTGTEPNRRVVIEYVR